MRIIRGLEALSLGLRISSAGARSVPRLDGILPVEGRLVAKSNGESQVVGLLKRQDGGFDLEHLEISTEDVTITTTTTITETISSFIGDPTTTVIAVTTTETIRIVDPFKETQTITETVTSFFRRAWQSAGVEAPLTAASPEPTTVQGAWKGSHGEQKRNVLIITETITITTTVFVPNVVTNTITNTAFNTVTEAPNANTTVTVTTTVFSPSPTVSIPIDTFSATIPTNTPSPAPTVSIPPSTMEELDLTTTHTSETQAVISSTELENTPISTNVLPNTMTQPTSTTSSFSTTTSTTPSSTPSETPTPLPELPITTITNRPLTRKQIASILAGSIVSTVILTALAIFLFVRYRRKREREQEKEAGEKQPDDSAGGVVGGRHPSPPPSSLLDLTSSEFPPRGKSRLKSLFSSAKTMVLNFFSLGLQDGKGKGKARPSSSGSSIYTPSNYSSSSPPTPKAELKRNSRNQVRVVIRPARVKYKPVPVVVSRTSSSSSTIPSLVSPMGFNIGSPFAASSPSDDGPMPGPSGTNTNSRGIQNGLRKVTPSSEEKEEWSVISERGSLREGDEEWERLKKGEGIGIARGNGSGVGLGGGSAKAWWKVS